jgi:PmbA protein
MNIETLRPSMEKMGDFAKDIGADAYDILAGASESSGISMFKGEVQNVEISSSRGIGIRIFRDGYPGYAHTERMTDEAIKDAVNSAWDNTYLTGQLKMKLPVAQELPQGDEDKLDSWSDKLGNIELDSFTPHCLEMEKVALDSEEIVNVPYLGMNVSASQGAILNSNGLFYSNRSNLLSGGVGCVARRDEVDKLGYYSKSLKSLELFKATEIGIEAVKRSKELLGAKTVKSGKYPVLLSNRISAQLLGMFNSGFYAERIQKGQSKLKGKLGQKIASDLVTIRNAPHRPDLSGSTYFDSEGVLTQDLDVIKNGQFESVLYNLESAAIDNVAPTGNGSRGYSGKSGTAFNNFVFDLGDSSSEQLIKELHTGLFIVKLEGGSGCSAISGDISIGAQGFWVENGVIVEPVDSLTLSTNYFDLLQNVVGVSSSYNDHFSSMKVPDLLISEMSVAG